MIVRPRVPHSEEASRCISSPRPEGCLGIAQRDSVFCRYCLALINDDTVTWRRVNVGARRKLIRSMRRALRRLDA